MEKKSQILALSIGLFVIGCTQIGFGLFGFASNWVGWLGVPATVLSALLGFVAYRDAFQLEVALEEIRRKHETIGSVANLANTKSDAALLGRSVSPDAAKAIVEGMAELNCAGARAVVVFIPHTNEASRMADSLAELLRAVRVDVGVPSPVNLHTGSQPKPKVVGTRVVLSGSAPDSVKKLAGLIAEHVEEAGIEGVSHAWPFTQAAYAMQIIVGSPKA